jgi:lipopolysaccharide transport system permease protein
MRTTAESLGPLSKGLVEESAHTIAGKPESGARRIRIEAGRKAGLAELSELWAYRELLYFLAWRDVKVRYKQTALGVAWALIQPVLTMVIFSIFFGRLAGVPSEGMPYPIFVYAGLLPWTFFSNAITSSGDSLVGDASLVTKVYFPRVVIPAAAVVAGLVDFALASVFFIAMMLYYGVHPGFGILMLPALVLVIVVLALAVGTWLAALNVQYRDVRYAAPFFIQLWLFVTPVIYPVNLVPDRWRWLFYLNPLTGLVKTFRAALLGLPVQWFPLVVATVLTLMLLVYTAHSFRRAEARFADVI